MLFRKNKNRDKNECGAEAPRSFVHALAHKGQGRRLRLAQDDKVGVCQEKERNPQSAKADSPFVKGAWQGEVCQEKERNPQSAKADSPFVKGAWRAGCARIM
jgi:hypothetical protein